MNEDLINRLAQHFGSKSAMCKALGIKRQNANKWYNTGIPATQAIAIERLTQGKFKAVEIIGGKDEQRQTA